MEKKHKCKLCSRSFSNGKALGGHMRSHLVTLPIPPKTHCPIKKHQLGDSTDSLSSLSSSSSEKEEERESEEKVSIYYGLRENPKKSFRLVDPEFLDRESETESTRMPTRRRSKLTRRMGVVAAAEEAKLPSSTESVAELEQVSSVSDTSDVALCLMMLSRDVWSSDDSEGMKPSQKRIKKCLEDHDGESEKPSQKVHKCPFCYKVFGSGQALGGHKRSHFLGSTTNSSTSAKLIGDNLVPKKCAKFGDTFIDLNLPAPTEDEEDFSAVFAVEFHQ